MILWNDVSVITNTSRIINCQFGRLLLEGPRCVFRGLAGLDRE